MGKRIASAAAAAILAVTGVVAVPAMAGPAAAASCSVAHSLQDGFVGHFIGSSVNIRTGPHTSCTSKGQGQLNQQAIYYCYVTGDTVSGITTWSWITDVPTGISGWVSDHYLYDDGALFHC